MRIVGTALVAGTIGVSFLMAEGGWTLAGTGQIAGTENVSPRTRHEVWSGYNRFQDFQGMKVENVDGEKIGRVHDLIVDLRSGMPEYVIVRSGRAMLGHRRSVVVPISAIALETAKAGIAAVDISKQQWKYAPEFSRKDMNRIGQPEKARQIARFYGRPESVPHIAKSAEGGLSSTGHPDRTNSGNQQVRFGLASELIGREVIDRQHVDVGSISDLLVNTAEMKPAFAIVSASRPAAASTSFAVPVQLLRPMPGDKVAVNATRQDFEHASRFSERETSAGRRNEIYRYER